MLNNTQRAQLAIWYEVNASLSAYNKLIKAFFNAEDAWQAHRNDWQKLRIHSKHLVRHDKITETHTFLKHVDTAIAQRQYQLVFADQIDYPQQLAQIFDPPPLLFARGNTSLLQEAQVAIVGSRKPTPHAQKITFDMAQYIAGAGYIITSGLAQGVDYQAHMGALSQTDDIAKGRTIGVMGTGIDVCYPRHHGTLFAQIIDEGGCLISELLPHTPANKHTFPRRNRIVSGLSLGTIVTEATIKSGSLITARLTSEQGKQVFAIPSHIDNVNAEGCHHLIREGATLIYHPDQVIEDLRYQQVQPTIATQVAGQTSTDNVSHETLLSDETIGTELLTTNTNTNTNTNKKTVSHKTNAITQSQSDNHIAQQNQQAMPLPNTSVPEHLSNLFTHIDWNGADVDSLVEKMQLPIHALLGQLMELELLGLTMEQGGRYVRV